MTNYESKKIMFAEPVEVKISELNEFLNKYKPNQIGCDVYPIQRFEYGDFDNYVNAVVDSFSIDPRYSHVYEDGTTQFSVRTSFWDFREGTKFWKEVPQVGYNTDYKKYNTILDVTVMIDGVFILPWRDKND